MWEHVGNDRAGLLAELINAFELHSQEHLELGCEIGNSSVVILRSTGLQPEGSLLEVNLPTFKRENLTLGPPAEGICDRCRNLEISREIFPHRLKLLTLKETLAWGRFP